MFGDILGAIGGLAGSIFGNRSQEKAAKQNIKLQKQFAQEGVQWKVADAEKAGVHPLYALGAQTHSFAPVSTGSDFSNLGNVGQNLGRAIDAGSTASQRITHAQSRMAEAQITGLELDNDIKRAELNSKLSTITNQVAPPVLPTQSLVIDGQGNAVTDSGIDWRVRKSPPATGPGSVEAGVSPEVSLYHAGTDSSGRPTYAPNIPQQLSESYESDTLGRWQWNFRNKIVPDIEDHIPPALERYLKPGEEWRYNPMMGVWQIMPKGRGYFQDRKRQ